MQLDPLRTAAHALVWRFRYDRWDVSLARKLVADLSTTCTLNRVTSW